MVEIFHQLHSFFQFIWNQHKMVSHKSFDGACENRGQQNKLLKSRRKAIGGAGKITQTFGRNFSKQCHNKTKNVGMISGKFVKAK